MPDDTAALDFSNDSGAEEEEEAAATNDGGGVACGGGTATLGAQVATLEVQVVMLLPLLSRLPSLKLVEVVTMVVPGRLCKQRHDSPQ